jgi:hypothetical protein
MDRYIKPKETLPHKGNRTKSFTEEQYSRRHKQAAESSRSQTPTDAAPGTILSKDSHPTKHSENVNSKSEAQPSPRKPSPRHAAVSSSRSGKPHTGQLDWQPMRRDLVAPNSGGGRPSHERAKPISRSQFRPSTSQSRRGENNASTSKDTTTAAFKPLPVQNRRPLLRGGLFDKVEIHNHTKEESSEHQGRDNVFVEPYTLDDFCEGKSLTDAPIYSFKS